MNLYVEWLFDLGVLCTTGKEYVFVRAYLLFRITKGEIPKLAL